MNSPIYNPVVPFTTGLTAMQPQLMICVDGTPTGARFHINFHTGPSEHDDVAFHFNPRFNPRKEVVRNTRTSGTWQAWDKHPVGFPFQMGKPFKVIILCQPHQFKVAVNGRHLLEYQHRLSYQSIRYMRIEGDVALSLVRTDFESIPPPAPVPTPDLVQTLNVPFPNIRGRKITVTGIPQNRRPHRFSINFRTGPGGDIFFHFNVRFDERQIVRNAQFSGAWGHEERGLSVPFPFQYGVPYQAAPQLAGSVHKGSRLRLVLITIHVDPGVFRAELNGMAICAFSHRKRPLTLIRQIEVVGATSVTSSSF